MFRRREPLPIHRRFYGLLWPRRGWRRATRYVAHRVGRIPGTPYRIAAGFACGAAISFTPFLGFHFLGAALLALLLRGNLLASAAGTVIGNPWTFPFIWVWTYGLGHWILGGEVVPLSPEQFSFTFIFDHFWNVFWPMTVGGIPTGVVAWFAFFWPIRALVAEYQHARRFRIRGYAGKRARALARRKAAAGSADSDEDKQLADEQARG
ncbi:MAG TPA: DUF2062 domain-containing protein [Kiloniellales bacterium]|nr:DUF2062 domain-containing protein [Kiloniellales bacterium]